jgi:hypothetical protein
VPEDVTVTLRRKKRKKPKTKAQVAENLDRLLFELEIELLGYQPPNGETR